MPTDLIPKPLNQQLSLFDRPVDLIAQTGVPEIQGSEDLHLNREVEFFRALTAATTNTKDYRAASEALKQIATCTEKNNALHRITGKLLSKTEVRRLAYRLLLLVDEKVKDATKTQKLKRQFERIVDEAINLPEDLRDE